MLKVINFELYKLFTGKKFYIVSIITAFLNIIVVGAIYTINNTEAIEQKVLMNGQSFPAFSLSQFAGQFLPILVIILLGGIVADEYRDGTLKLALLNPINRAEVLVAKIITIITSIVLLLATALISGYLAGIVAFGWGEEFIIPQTQQLLTTSEGIIKTIVAYGYTVIPFIAFCTAIFLFSILISNSSMVFGVSIGIFFTFGILLSFLNDLKPYIINYYFTLSNEFYSTFSSTDWVRTSLVLSAYIIIPALSAFRVFKRKDIVF